MTRINNASAEIYNAEQRLKDCPALKKFIWDWCLNEVKHEQHFSIRGAMEAARRYEWIKTDGDPFGLNNSLSPAMARLFIKEHPEAKQYIELRRAACDGMEA